MKSGAFVNSAYISSNGILRVSGKKAQKEEGVCGVADDEDEVEPVADVRDGYAGHLADHGAGGFGSSQWLPVQEDLMVGERGLT